MALLLALCAARFWLAKGCRMCENGAVSRAGNLILRLARTFHSGMSKVMVRQPACACAAHGVPALAGRVSPLEGGPIHRESAFGRLKPGLHTLRPSVPFEICGLGFRLCVWVLFAGTVLRLAAQSDQAVYADALSNGWQNYGWTQIDYATTNFVHSGSKAISVTITNNSYQAIYLHHAAFDSSPYTSLTFWIHGGTNGGQLLQVRAELNGAAQTAIALAPLTANAWDSITFSLADLGVANRTNFDGFWIQDRVGSAQPTFYVDDISLAGAAPSIVVDALRNRHPISPFIYGTAFASSTQLADLNSPLNRSGGNAETRYNWQINAHNRAADFYFESIGDSPATAGAAADSFVTSSKAGGAQPMLTVPMIGWVAKLGSNRAKLASYSIAKYGPQTGNDSQYFADAGNGVIVTNMTNNILINWNDPNDANVLTDSAYQQGWIQHLTNRWGISTNGGVRYYLMDNESSIWHSTHRDVHPAGATMREIRDKFFDYAAVVKAVDAAALVLGPEEWGWSGYFYSGFDQQWSNTNKDYIAAHFPDRATNGGWDYLPWFLDQARQHATNTNQRLLDVFTVHFYPQGGESGSDVTGTTQLLRNRSTRSLWDPAYIDQSWISSVVKLIPRLKGWVTNYYPGTPIGITEYNWGAENHINGATAQADILGIFGRENLDYATRWTTPASTTPTYKAMKLYRNYDGNQSAFGDTSISATAPNPDTVATFAATRSTDGALTLVVINKQLSNAAPARVTLTNFLPSGTAQLWQLTSANSITRLSDVAFTGNTFSNSLPPQSITLFVLPAGSPPHLRPGAISATNTFDFWLDGLAGQRYVVQSSSNLVNWPPMQTNTLSSNSVHIVVPATGTRFYRAVWVP